MSHKGDWSRVKDRKSYQDNYETIFRKADTSNATPVCICAEESQKHGDAGINLQEREVDGSQLRQDQQLCQGKQNQL